MSHDEPQFGERAEANNPEALHQSMMERGYQPWTPGSVTGPDAKEIRALAGEPKQHHPREPLGRVGKIVVGSVLVATVAPFILLLWHWALGVVL